MVLGSHANTRAMYSTPPWPSLAASMAAYRRRSFSDNHPKKRCIFSSISAEYTSMLDSLSQNLCCRKDTTAQACREVILDHILSALGAGLEGHCEREDHQLPNRCYSELNSSLMVQGLSKENRHSARFSCTSPRAYSFFVWLTKSCT